jgi:predicted dehydrogenase/threonine dehydrogenase-like Zn-dependent dehydrogenase
MKQVVQNLRSGETIVVDVPTPQPHPGMALVKTAASLVSVGTERMLVDFASKSLLGKARSRPDLARQVIDKARREGILTTMEAASNRLDQPMPLGYSSAGEIVGLGEDIRGFKLGQRVACAGGGYAVHAEYALVPKNLLAALSDNIDYESAAFTTLGAIALHGFRLSEAVVGEQVTIIGLGLLGLLTVAIANAAGCKVLGIDLDPNRVQLAETMGAMISVSRDEAEPAALNFSRGRGSDVVLICADTSSSDPVELAGVIARDKARIVATGAVGLEIPRKVYYEKELSFVNSRSYGPGRYDPTYEESGQDYPIGYVRWTEGRNLEAFIDLLSTNRVDVHPLITHRYPVEQAPNAYDLITGHDGRKFFLGVLLTYDLDGVSKAELPPSSRDHVDIGETKSEPQTDGVSDKVQLAVLGAGNFASAVMLPTLSKIDDLELVGIASASGLSAQNAASKFNFNYATSDESKILADQAINTVAILTRHQLHSQQVIAALNAGKHVFCEKPLAITIQDLEDVFEVLENLSDRNQMLMVGFNRRFAPFSQQLKAFLGSRQEPLMANYRVNAGYLPPGHWLHDTLQGGGRIIGEGCHFIDYLTFLVGEPPSSVAALALPDGGRYQEDNVHLTFTFPDGSIGTIDYMANGDQTFAKERLEVFTAGRIAVLDDFRILELVHNGKRKLSRSRLRQDKGHRAEWQAFQSAIRQNGQPPIPYSQLYGVSIASILAAESLKSGDTIPIPSRNQI